MKNLIIKKLIIVPYTLVSLSITSSFVNSNFNDALIISSGVHVSNLEVENNKKRMSFVYNTKKKIKSIF